VVQEGEQLAHGPKDVFTVVDDQQKIQLLERLDESLTGCGPWSWSEPHGAGHQRGNSGYIVGVERRQIDKCRSRRVLGAVLLPGFDRESGFAHACWSNDGHKSVVVEKLTDRSQLIIATEQRCCWSGEGPPGR
jgi:hypothetical protein